MSIEIHNIICFPIGDCRRFFRLPRFELIFASCTQKKQAGFNNDYKHWRQQNCILSSPKYGSAIRQQCSNIGRNGSAVSDMVICVVSKRMRTFWRKFQKRMRTFCKEKQGKHIVPRKQAHIIKKTNSAAGLARRPRYCYMCELSFCDCL